MRKFVRLTMYYNNHGATTRSWFSDTLAMIVNSRLQLQFLRCIRLSQFSETFHYTLRLF